MTTSPATARKALYPLLLNTGEVIVSTAPDGQRVVSDRYVIVTCPLAGEAFTGLPDGTYRLLSGKEPRRLAYDLGSGNLWRAARRDGGPWSELEPDPQPFTYAVGDPSLIYVSVARDGCAALNARVVRAWREFTRETGFMRMELSAGGTFVRVLNHVRDGEPCEAGRIMCVRVDDLPGSARSFAVVLGSLKAGADR
jgi:hypothetical protein